MYETLIQMHSDKSQRPDGINPYFYQQFWGMCGDNIYSVISNWLERGFFPSTLNDTNIFHIPKCENPRTMKDMYPITL